MKYQFYSTINKYYNVTKSKIQNTKIKPDHLLRIPNLISFDSNYNTNRENLHWKGKQNKVSAYRFMITEEAIRGKIEEARRGRQGKQMLTDADTTLSSVSPSADVHKQWFD